MANLIITVIAIALVAVASLMGAYYGGAAFMNNQASAGASTALNQGQQLKGAWVGYLNDNFNTSPTNISQLISSGYLAAVPISPAAAGGVTPKPIAIGTATATVGGVSGTHYFAYSDLGTPSGTTTASYSDNNATGCDRIVKTATGQPASSTTLLTSGVGSTPGTVFSGAGGNGTYGCAYMTTAPDHSLTSTASTISANHYVVEYLIQ